MDIKRNGTEAWRAKTWPAGKYSLARFELRAEGDQTRLVFDHDGFAEADPQVSRLTSQRSSAGSAGGELTAA